MIGFWIAAAALAGLAAALIASRAAGSARFAANDSPDPAVELYRRQLTEVDELADRGLLDPEDHRQAFAEAGRRLLAAQAQPEPTPTFSRAAGLAALIVGGLAAVAALALYLPLGSPGMADQPFAARLKAWRAAPPQTLDPARMAAVLDSLAAERPKDPQVYLFLGRARLAAGDPYGAADALKQAVRLAPGDAEVLGRLAQAQMALATDGAVTPDAEVTFQQVLKLDPGNVAARYFLAQALIGRGRTDEGLSAWKTLRDQLPPDDSRRKLLESQLAQAGAGAASSGPSPAAVAAAQAQTAGDAGAQAAMIQGMVERLAARLKANPDDAAGWARLVRSYGMLGKTDAQKAALAEARRLFARRPADLAKIEAEAKAAAPAR